MYNFISTFDELNKLYEEAPKVVSKVKKHEEAKEPIEEACAKEELTEAADNEEIEIVDDEAPVEEIAEEEPVGADEPRQVIMECSKCGALVIKDEADVVADEESDLVNIEDECQYCEEAEGYKIIGSVMPFEESVEEPVVEEEPVEEAIEDEVVEEGLLDIKTPATIAADILN